MTLDKSQEKACLNEVYLILLVTYECLENEDNKNIILNKHQMNDRQKGLVNRFIKELSLYQILNLLSSYRKITSWIERNEHEWKI
jgi:hypothetical protein